MPISIRVRAKTNANEFRVITVQDDGSNPSCDCGGFNGVICSHIDAVLIANERAMVHEEDYKIADLAFEVIAGRLRVPEDWRRAWRSNNPWQGLKPKSNRPQNRDRSINKPIVCFTGKMDRKRSLLKLEAEQAGWTVINGPSPNTDVLVAADSKGMESKLIEARKNLTPIVSMAEWTDIIETGVLPD